MLPSGNHHTISLALSNEFNLTILIYDTCINKKKDYHLQICHANAVASEISVAAIAVLF
jgi:hypothetical protein